MQIKPFSIRVSDEVLSDLETRLRNTRWPDPAPGAAWEQARGRAQDPFVAMIRALVLLVLSLTSAGCYYREEIAPEVTMREWTRFEFEVQIHKHVESRGNSHDLFDLEKREYETSDWLYLPRSSGRIQADELVFSRHWRCLDDPWRETGLRGHVELAGDVLTIHLEAPSYESGQPAGYRPLTVNGRYRVKRATAEPFSPPAADLTGACEHGG